MGAASVIVTGGFEGLGDPELDANHETTKARRKLNSSHSTTALEMERNSFSMSTTQMNREDKLNEVNPEGEAVPIRIQTGMRTSSRFNDFIYLTGLGNPCPWKMTPPVTHETTNIPLCSSEAEPEPSYTSDLIIKKKVRFNDDVQVIEIERVEPNLEKFNNKFYIPSKSSNSEASPDLNSQAQGKINNPASNKDMQSIFKGLFKK